MFSTEEESSSISLSEADQQASTQLQGLCVYNDKNIIHFFFRSSWDTATEFRVVTSSDGHDFSLHKKNLSIINENGDKEDI